MKGFGILLVIVLIFGGGYYYFTANNEIVVDSDSPLKVIKGSLGGMSTEERAEFDAAVDDMKDVVKEMNEDMDDDVSLLASGNFMESAHTVEGKVLLIDDNGKKVVRFEDFRTINGPALYIYLSTGLDDGDFVDLGEIKATKGNVNYDVPEGTDTDKYNKVLVWCRPFSILFSYAELKSKKQ
jgi:hypothetical protein